MELRPYQRDAVDAIYKYFSENNGNPLVVVPTGGGKSLIIASFLREAIFNWPDTRVIVLTHVKELIQQNFNALISAWNEAPAGICSAGLGSRDLQSQIIFAGIQSIYKRAYEVQKCELVLIDEAHLLNKSASGMYRRFLTDLKAINPHLKIVGFTATPYRLDQGMLTDGDDALFTDIAYDIPLLKMIDEGYLVPLIPKQTETSLDVSGVHTRGGEFIQSELEDAVDLDPVNRSAVDEIISQGQDRGSWLVFCSGVRHAEHIRDIMREKDITCDLVCGDTPAAQRDRTLQDFKAGRVRCVTNMNVLTVGFDAPGIDLIAMLRPTKSLNLYVQMLGRGTRLATGKEDCLVLDFAGNTKRLGPVDMVHKMVKKPGQPGEGQAPTKTCPKCQMICFAGVAVCRNCGHVFPPPKPELDTKASTNALLSSQIQMEWLKVSNVMYSLHEKPGKPKSLLVTYQTGLSRHREWVCLEHSGYPREKACKWWGVRSYSSHIIDVPNDVAEALSQVSDLKKPVEIMVKPSGKYTDIVGYRF